MAFSMKTNTIPNTFLRLRPIWNDNILVCLSMCPADDRRVVKYIIKYVHFISALISSIAFQYFWRIPPPLWLWFTAYGHIYQLYIEHIEMKKHFRAFLGFQVFQFQSMYQYHVDFKSLLSSNNFKVAFIPLITFPFIQCLTLWPLRSLFHLLCPFPSLSSISQWHLSSISVVPVPVSVDPPSLFIRRRPLQVPN